MSTTPEPLTSFDIITSLLVFFSFVAAILCIATLRYHVDEEKIRSEKSVSAHFRSQIPPEHLLTPEGKKRVKIAKTAIGVCFVTVAVIIVKVQILKG